MARIGSFSPPSFIYGTPLAIAHPIDNVFPRFDPGIAAEPGLTDAQRQELQDELNEIFAAARLAREYRILP